MHTLGKVRKLPSHLHCSDSVVDIIAGASALADVTMNYGIGVLLLAVVGSFKDGAFARLLLFEFEIALPVLVSVSGQVSRPAMR